MSSDLRWPRRHAREECVSFLHSQLGIRDARDAARLAWETIPESWSEEDALNYAITFLNEYGRRKGLIGGKASADH